MAIFGALSTARSGLVASSASLAVISNNIANVNTFGFKASRAEFATLLAAFNSGASADIGLGVLVGSVSPEMTQGSIENTGRPTDLAIEGNGFFVVRAPEGNVFTRAGDFRLDATGTLVSFQGLPVQGFALNSAGQPIGAAVDISVTGASSQPLPTTLASLKANLRADATIIGPFDGTDFDTAAATSNFTTSVNVYDSLGARHTLTVYFTKTAANQWDFNVGIDGAEISGGTPDTFSPVGNGSLTFNPDGSLNATVADPVTFAGVNFNGANPQDITFNFGTPNPTAVVGDGVDGITQYAAQSSAGQHTQNGFGAGQLLGLQFSEDGIVTGLFSNGQTRALFQLALANFNAPDQLDQIGNNLLRETTASGTAAIGPPKSGGLGSIVPSAIEQSNVDLAQQFVELISTQRSFQANSRVITVSDTLLSDLINIVR